VFRATSVSWPEAEELLWRTAFRVFALRLRALASLLLALERRRIVHPRLQDYADFQVALQQGFALGEMGFNDAVFRQASWVGLHASTWQRPHSALGGWTPDDVYWA
jgi:hypothetical protein